MILSNEDNLTSDQREQYGAIRAARETAFHNITNAKTIEDIEKAHAVAQRRTADLYSFEMSLFEEIQ